MEKNSQMGDLLNKHNFDKRFVLGVDSAPFMPKVVQIFARKVSGLLNRSIDEIG